MAAIVQVKTEGDEVVLLVELRLSAEDLTDGVGIPVPGSEVQVPARIDWAAIAAPIALARRTRIVHVYELIRALDRRDRTGIAAALSQLVTDGTIIASERTAIVAVLQGMVTRSTYPRRVAKSLASLRNAWREALVAEVTL